VVVHINELFKLNMFSSGRRMLALRKVRSEARELGFHSLVKHINESLAYEEEIRALERRWRNRDTSDTLAREIDMLVDPTLTALRDAALSQAAGARPDDPIVGTVNRFIAVVFPGGVKAITALAFADELAAVEDIVRALEGELWPMVEELGLVRLARRLAALAVEYRAALEADKEVLHYDRVRTARNRGQDNLCRAVGLIVTRYHDDSDEHSGARSRLLAPILEQNEAIRSYLRARRAVPDVDPDTGLLESADSDDAGAGDAALRAMAADSAAVE
jgi:hypothetical protein